MILYEEAGLSALELWRGVSRRATLFQLRERKHEYFPALRDFLIALHRGEAESRDTAETAALRKARDFERVIFVGGEAGHPLLAESLASIPLPFEYDIPQSGPFAGHRGAQRIFGRMGWKRGLALDLGQTQLKIMTAAETRRIPRDPEFLPFGANSLDEITARARLREFVSQGISKDADGVILALPVEIMQPGVARASTYPGLFGPIEPIFDGLFEVPWVVMNDAVLAAAGFRPSNWEKRLVITLGYGIGGALWNVT